jgi:2-polyprenyl-3-methyl-5-hydroxy-6-metoxy-1,4-benzoquinol methylase
MCHKSVLAWAGSLPADLFAGQEVVEVGAHDVNGTVRPIIEAHSPASYLGVDISAGAGVDLVSDVADLPRQFPGGFDVVVTTEMLEHVEDWRAVFWSLAALTRIGGHLVLSTRSPGFPFHAFPIDCWRYPRETMVEILTAVGFEVDACLDDAEAPGVFALATKRRNVRRTKTKNLLAVIEVPGV